MKSEGGGGGGEEGEGGKVRREGWESGERWEEGGGEEKEELSLISYQCGGMQTVQLWIASQSNPFLKVANRIFSVLFTKLPALFV